MDTLSGAPESVNAQASPPKVRRTIRQSYRGIDVAGDKSTWPATPLPKLTGPEAIAAAKRLWRVAVGRAWPGTWELTSGNRHARISHGVFYVNPDRGWMQLVHSISHRAYRYLTFRNMPMTTNTKGERVMMVSRKLHDDYRTASRKGHNDDHAHLEKKLVALVIDSGWLNGNLKQFSLDEPEPKPNLRDRNEAKVDAAIVRWREKLAEARKQVDKAEKRLRELGVKKRYYDRQRA